MLRLLAITSLLLAAGSVAPMADEARAELAKRNPKLGRQDTSGHRPPDCMCRLRSGTRVPLGTHTCLTVGGRTFTAQCRMAGNVTMWREVVDGCPTG